MRDGVEQITLCPACNQPVCVVTVLPPWCVGEAWADTDRHAIAPHVFIGKGPVTVMVDGEQTPVDVCYGVGL